MASLSGFVIAIVVLLAGGSAARDLRPSEHGLVFQASPPANSSVEMRSFFNSNKGSSPSDAPLQNVTESMPPSWWRATGDGSGGGSHLRGALMMASLVCGITGGVLLVASALLYLFKHRRRPNQNDSFRPHSSGTNDHHNFRNNNANKLQLVPAPRNP
ncbi:hypothetical protein VNO77_25497 [Canavalia gladiata]|uniref:Uncharacterized protein n=1 Tax=Canavalia gladiata TaxID=3824 RepID=A0AAN9QDK9_CANGL